MGKDGGRNMVQDSYSKVQGEDQITCDGNQRVVTPPHMLSFFPYKKPEQNTKADTQVIGL